jgi:transaldolase
LSSLVRPAQILAKVNINAFGLGTPLAIQAAEIGDLEAIRQFTPRDATTNPSLILAAAQMPAYQDLIDRSLRESRQVIGREAGADAVVSEALDAGAFGFSSSRITAHRTADVCGR